LNRSDQLRLRLEELKAGAARAKDVMDSVYEHAQEIDERKGRAEPDARTVKKWRDAVETWTKLNDLLVQAEDEYRRVGRHPLPVVVMGRKKKIVEDLQRQYGDHGPQYQMLVEMVASKKIRLESMDEAGIYGVEYDGLARALREDIGQLQRYTEATKSEAIHKEVNEVGALILGMVDRYLHDQPTLFRTIVQAVRRAIESGGAGILSVPDRLALAAPGSTRGPVQDTVDGVFRVTGNQEVAA